MTEAGRAVERLQRRRERWLLAGLLFLLLAALAGWRLWHFWQTAWSLPLDAPLTDIHFPPQVFNEDGRLERPYHKGAIGLSLLAMLAAGLTLLLRRGVDGRARVVMTLVGFACTAMMLITAVALQSDLQVNREVRALADGEHYAELERLTRRRPGLPYGKYIGAQALVLAGKQGQLRPDYGPWLQDWGRQAATLGYRTPDMIGREVPSWQGSSASPRVMRALEQLAFGRGISVFAAEYEAQAARDARTAQRQGAAVSLVFGLFLLLAALAALRARRLAARIAQAEARLVWPDFERTQAQ